MKITPESFQRYAEKWVAIPGDPDGAEVLLRSLPESLAIEIEIEHKSEGRDGHGLFEKLAGGIVDWKGVFDNDNKKMPLNEDNKRIFLRLLSAEAFLTLASALNDVAKTYRDKKESAEKN